MLLLGLWPVPGTDAADGLRIALRPRAEVAGRIVTIGDLAELSGDAALAARLAGVTVLELGDLAEHRLTAAQVQSAAAAAAPGRALQAVGECRVTRRALVVDADAMVAAAVAAAGAAGGADGDRERVATRVRDGGALTVPDDVVPVRLVAEALDRSPGGEIPYRVRVLRGESELGRTLVTLLVARYRTVVVAARTIHTSEVVAAGDMRSARLAVDAVNRYAPAQADALLGPTARVDIAEGTPSALGLLRPHLDVHGGEAVTQVYSRDGFAVSGAGEALGDGKVGDLIQVRRSSDGGCVKGRVTAPGEVRINY